MTNRFHSGAAFFKGVTIPAMLWLAVIHIL